MRQMKDSGIEWIGKIPEDWAIERMKSLFTERNERDCKGRTLLSVSQFWGIRPKSETDIADSHIAESYDDYKEVYQGDFVMNIMLAWNGSYAVSEYDGMVSPAYCVFKFRKGCCKKYFHYLLRTNGYSTAFKTMSRGVIDSRLRLYPEQFYTFPIIIPSIDEQQRIADYLDKKCGEIDSLIALQEQMIEKLKAYKQSVITEAVTKGLDPNAKLVPSGIDWIGEIPEGWKVCRIKDLVIMKSGSNLTSEQIANEGSYPVYGGNGLRGYYEAYSNEGDYVLVGRQGALCGNINYAFGRFWATDHAVVCYPRRNFSLIWFGETLRSMNLGQYSLSAAQPGLSVDRIREKKMPLPPLSEQQTIASYLDEKCADIDRLIALKQQKIESLKDYKKSVIYYKKSVIYEAVTGKTEI